MPNLTSRYPLFDQTEEKKTMEEAMARLLQKSEKNRALLTGQQQALFQSG